MLRSRRERSAIGLRTAALLLCAAIALPALPAHAVEPAAYVPRQLLVKYRPNATPASRRAFEKNHRARRLRAFQRIGIDHLELERGERLEKALEHFRKSPLVEYAEPNYILRMATVPNDPRFPELYGMRNTGQSGGTSGADIDAVPAWDLSTGDPNLKIGIIDTGIDYNHPDLKDNVWTNTAEASGTPGVDDDGNGYVDDIHGYDVLHHDGDPMDDNGHGTHTAGILAARGSNALGVAGVVWRAKLVAIKFLDASGQGTNDGAIDAIEYAIAAGVRLTSNSWAGGGYSQALLDAIEAAGAAHQLFVAAAGNAATDIDAIPSYPAAYPSEAILSVAATDRYDHLATFSNYGVATVDVAAPGVNVLSTLPGGSYGELSGTSMSTPHVAGIVALAMSRFPTLTAAQVKALVLYSADSLSALVGRVKTAGRVNALRTIAVFDTIAPSATMDLTVLGAGSTTISLRWTAPGDDGNAGRASRYEIRVATAPITPQSFAAATLVGSPVPANAGTLQTHEIAGLAYSTPYYVALRAFDEFGNGGPLSNVATATTLAAPALGVAPATLSSTLLTGAQKSVTLTLTNTGQGTLDFTLPRPEIEVPQGALNGGANDAIVDAEGIGHHAPPAKGERDDRIGAPVTEDAGGPDAYGYRWVDSDETGGPSFAWTDIATSGQRVQIFGDDAISNPIPIGFSFPFYGVPFSTVRVCSNGYLSFGDSSIAVVNLPLPNIGAPANLLAPLWDDLDFAGDGMAYSRSDGERFIVSWLGVPHFGGGGPYSFQVILHPTGEIRFQYRTLGAPTNQATVGLQDGTRATGLTVAFNTAYLHDSLAVRILPLQQWLTVSPASGRIAAGQSVNLAVQFDARLMQGGVYHGAIRVLHNAPGGERSIPTTLTVDGVADVDAVPGSMPFGTVYLGSTARDTLTVINAGSDSLRVDSLLVHDAAWSAPATPFRLGPGGRKVIMVSCHPLVIGPQAATLRIYSNDPDEPALSIPLSAQSTPPPDISVAPDSVAADLPTGGHAERIITITNHGQSPLPFDIGVVEIGDPEPLRGRTAVAALPLRTWPQFEAMTMPLASPPRPVTQTPNPLPCVVWDAAGDGGEFDVSRVDAACSGGVLEIELVFTAPIDRAALGGFISLDVDQNPLTGAAPTFGTPEQDIGVEYQFALFGVEYGAVDLYDAVTGVLVGQYAATSDSLRVRFGVPLADLGGDDGRLDITGVVGGLAGPTDWVPDRGHGTVSGFGWLSATPSTGVVPAAGSAQVTLRFDAKSLEGGVYLSDVAVRSTDPDQPEVRVRSRLRVTTAPDADAFADSIDFGTLYPGQSRADTLRLTNLGMAPLAVSSLTVNPASFTLPTGGFSIAPGASRAIAVTYTPPSAGTSAGSVVVHSNDPDEAVLTIALQGRCVQPPDIAFSPGAFDTTLQIGQTANRKLVIANRGASPLEFALEVVVDPLSATERPPALAARAGQMTGPAMAGPVGPERNAASAPRTVIETEYQGTNLHFGITDYGELIPFAYPTGHEHLAVGTYLSGYSLAYRAGGHDRVAYTGIDVRQNIVPVTYHELLNDATRVQVEVTTMTADSSLEVLRRFTFYRSERSIRILTTVRNRSAAVLEDVVLKAWADWDVDGDSENDTWDYDAGRHMVLASDQHFVALASEQAPDAMDIFGWNDYAARATQVDVAATPVSGLDGLAILHFELGDLLPSWSRSITVACAAADDRAGLLDVVDRSARLSDWLLVSPIASVIDAGDSLDLVAALASAGLAVGDYAAHVVVHSNDPDEPEVTIPITLHVSVASAAAPVAGAPRELGLRLAGPNPTRGATRLDLALPHPGHVDVQVFDVRGALVRRLVDAVREAGLHRLVWSGEDEAGHPAQPGIYLIRARAAGRDITQRVVVVR